MLQYVSIIVRFHQLLSFQCMLSHSLFCMSVYLSVCLSVSLSVCVTVCVSLCLCTF